MYRKFFLIVMFILLLPADVFAGKLYSPQPNKKTVIIRRRDTVAKNALVPSTVSQKTQKTVDAKDSAAWKRTGSQVNTWLERRYDKNYDGVLQPQEVRQLLTDRHERLIRILQKRNPPVDSTSVESYYDFDKNGVFDKEELQQMKEDLS